MLLGSQEDRAETSRSGSYRRAVVRRLNVEPGARPSARSDVSGIMAQTPQEPNPPTPISECMNEKGNKYAIAALRDKRATIASEIVQLERQLRHKRENLVHVDATLAILDPDSNPEAIPNNRVVLGGSTRRR